MELTWQNVLMQAIPVLGGALAALLGALPGYFKDKRELAAKERMAAEERKHAQENERQTKTYEERKNAYMDYISALQNVITALPKGGYIRNMDIAIMSHSNLLLFCSENVMSEADNTIDTLKMLLKDFYKTNVFNEENYKTYMRAFGKMVPVMRLDLGIHKTELC